jgi:hypothetical protein
VLKVITNIIGELLGRRVALCAILSHRFERDPFQLTAELAAQFVQRNAAFLCNVAAYRSGEARQPRARPRRLDVADDPLDLARPRAAQRVRVERQRARQQLVQHDAQRINVAARIHVQRAHFRLFWTDVLRRPDEPARLRVQGRLREPLTHGFGDAEVDHLHNVVLVLEHHEDVRRLEVSMKDRLLMRVLDRSTRLDEQLQALACRELVTIAECGDRLARDVFHHEVRSAGVGGAGVEDFRDVGVIHQRKGLALGFEARNHVASVHAELDKLQRDGAADRVRLLAAPHDAHATFADLLEQAVSTDRHLRPELLDLHNRAVEHALGRVVAAQQLLDFRAERCVVAAGCFEIPSDARTRSRSTSAGRGSAINRS